MRRASLYPDKRKYETRYLYGLSVLALLALAESPQVTGSIGLDATFDSLPMVRTLFFRSEESLDE